MTSQSRTVPAILGALAVPLAMAPAAEAAGPRSQPAASYYVEARGGLNLLSDPTFAYTPTGGTKASGKASVGTGLLVGAAAGVRLQDRFRLEAEYLYRANSLSSVAVPQFAGVNDGDFNSVVIAANAYYDYGGWAVASGRLRPYVGVGLAYVQELDTDLKAPGRPALQFSNDRFGYQLLAGANLEWTSGLYVGAGVRYTAAGKAKLTGSAGTLETDYKPIAVTASLGYRF